MTNRPVMPAFVFDRRRSAELEAGFVLAGQLIVDLPKRRRLKPRHARQVGAIVQMLVAEARSRGLPGDGMVIGWAGGVKPEGAVDVHDDAIMGAWAARSLVVAVRIDPRDDGFLRVDSDALAQMGLGPWPGEQREH